MVLTREKTTSPKPKEKEKTISNNRKINPKETEQT